MELTFTDAIIFPHRFLPVTDRGHTTLWVGMAHSITCKISICAHIPEEIFLEAAFAFNEEHEVNVLETKSPLRATIIANVVETGNDNIERQVHEIQH